MADYTLHYWPIQFRGQFVRSVLAATGSTWTEAGIDATADLRLRDPSDQPVPHMGPPVLTDHATGLSLSQMPAILGYLGRRHGLLSGKADKIALTDKIIGDANDVLYDMTRYNGAQRWTDEAWKDFQPRLDRWMRIFEATGRSNGLTDAGGHMLGTPEPGIADYTVATLWGAMTTILTPLRPRLDQQAPAIAALCDRIAARPEQQALQRDSDRDFGPVWCGGQIEASLRDVLGMDQ
ncbi:glutathione S-transferase [Oceanicola sp. 22II-s10i]|uniref:glutathione S-transferase n=1 Tax=Oceanicola sp. 22II-s10i TaxID=1317116 RepID=UPI000B524B83|nr:glutathione S-transferase [Oceanicola sp. 22II-s10i]OWU85450.1 glutathione S-transferase [Oceanicola sp. 22II-s10i]